MPQGRSEEGRTEEGRTEEGRTEEGRTEEGRTTRRTAYAVAAAGIVALAALLALFRAPAPDRDPAGGSPPATQASGPRAAPDLPSPGSPSAVVHPPTGAPAVGVAPPNRTSEPRVTGRPEDGDAVRVRLRAPWGAGAGAVGRDVPAEGAPVGPMSFAVGRGGTLYVLDNANQRVQVFAAGVPPHAVPLPQQTAQDLALAPGDRLAVLDRTRERSVTLLERDGTLVADVPIEGVGVPNAAGVTGLDADDDGIWVEVEHGRRVQIADADGAPVAVRRVVPGRVQPTRDRAVTAHLQRPDRVVVLTHALGTPPGEAALLAEVAFGLPVHHLVGLGFDAAGAIYLGVWLARFEAVPPYAVAEERIEVVHLSADGAELARAALPAAGRPEEQFRSLVVTEDGIVYHLAPTDEGIVVREVVP